MQRQINTALHQGGSEPLRLWTAAAPQHEAALQEFLWEFLHQLAADPGAHHLNTAAWAGVDAWTHCGLGSMPPDVYVQFKKIAQAVVKSYLHQLTRDET